MDLLGVTYVEEYVDLVQAYRSSIVEAVLEEMRQIIPPEKLRKAITNEIIFLVMKRVVRFGRFECKTEQQLEALLRLFEPVKGPAEMSAKIYEHKKVMMALFRSNEDKDFRERQVHKS